MHKVKWRIAQFLEYLWWRKYLLKKDKHQYLDKKKAYWINVISSFSDVFQITPGQRILDAGCGPAGIFTVLDKNVVTAIDPLLNRYDSLQVFDRHDYGWVEFVNTPIESFSSTEKFDVIFCLNAINHVADIDLCYDRLFEALSDNGVLIVSTDAHRSMLLKKIFQLLPGDLLHPVQLDIDEYNQKLRERNAVLLKCIEYKKGNIFNYYISVARKGVKD